MAYTALTRLLNLVSHGSQGQPRVLETGRSETLRPDKFVSGQGPGADERTALLAMRDFENAGLGWFYATDSALCLTYVSDAIARLLDRSCEELIGQPLLSLFNTEPCDEVSETERTLALVLATRKKFSKLVVRAADLGEGTLWALAGQPQLSPGGDFLGFYGSGFDITVTRRSHLDATRLAWCDSLTGLSNRPRMAQQLAATLNAYKASKRACAVMMIDLDRFKEVNDTLGHPAGDALLKQVGERLERVIDKATQIGRLGGDEFQIILPDVDDRGRLGEIARSVIDKLSEPYLLDGGRCVIGASIGVAIAPYDGETSEELVRSADLALYAAKDNGRGQFRFFSTDLQEMADRRRQLEEELRDALGKDQISLAYKPVMIAASDTVAGLEAVLRWDHPEFGALAPELFLPIAEDSQLIAPLGEWALRQACDDAAQWSSSVGVAVNVSPSQFTRPGFAAVVASALASSGLDPARLELELTERVFLSDTEFNERVFAELRALGVKLVLDDFGTGYSSLGYLRKAPFDKIKIDKTFIRGSTEQGNRNGAIISAIVSLTRALGLDTMAEGVEALDELELMRSLGVKLVQGPLYSTALPFAEVCERMASGTWIIPPVGPASQRAGRRTILRQSIVIHEDQRYDVLMRNLSRTGALIEGLIDVPLNTQFVVDFGEGQLAVANVCRSDGALQGLAFEIPLVDDGAGGLCTRHRVSPYVLAAAGAPTEREGGFTMPKFARLNLKAKAAG